MKCKECGHDKENHSCVGCLHGKGDSYCPCKVKKDAIVLKGDEE